MSHVKYWALACAGAAVIAVGLSIADAQNAQENQYSSKWVIDKTTSSQISLRDVNDLTEDAFHFGVPPEKVDEALALLFKSGNSQAIPDETPAKQRLYALVIAQQRIAERRVTGETVDEEKIRAATLSEIENVTCSVSPASAGQPDLIYRDFSGELAAADVEKVKAYAEALKVQGAQIDAYLKNIESLPENVTDIPPMPAAPTMPLIANPGLDQFNALGPQGQNALREELKMKALGGFSCLGGKAGHCVKSVSFKTGDGFTSEPMQRYYRISAVAECRFEAN